MHTYNLIQTHIFIFPILRQELMSTHLVDTELIELAGLPTVVTVLGNVDPASYLI